MQTQLPTGSNANFGFYPTMKATVKRRRNRHVIVETTASIQSSTELFNFLRASGCPATLLEAEWDFSFYGNQTYTVEIK